MGAKQASWEDNLSDADKKSLAVIREANRKIAAMAPKPEAPVGPTVPSPRSIKYPPQGRDTVLDPDKLIGAD